jgi:hypothetical protein
VDGPEEDDQVDGPEREGDARRRGVFARLAKRSRAEIVETQGPDEALWELQQFTGRVVKKYGADSVNAARAQVELSLQLGKMRRWDEALLLREHSLETFRTRRGEDDPETLRTEVSLAIALAHTGRWTESEDHLHHAASTGLEALGPDDEVTRLAEAKLEEFRRSQADNGTG